MSHTHLALHLSLILILSGPALSTGSPGAVADAPGLTQSAQPTPSTPPTPPPHPPILLSALFADGYAAGDADEAVQLWNVGEEPVSLAGWSITDGEGSAAFPPSAELAAGRYTWLTRDAAAFERSFGHAPDWVWGSGPADSLEVPSPGRLVSLGGGPTLANAGEAVVLRGTDGAVVDGVVFGKDGPLDPLAPSTRWLGPPVLPYHAGIFSAAHQVLYRKLDMSTGLPRSTDSPTASASAPASVSASVWASDPADPIHGRRLRFPGWDLEARLRPAVAVEPAHVAIPSMVEVAVAPDALYAFLRRHLASARYTVDMEVYTFENPDLAEVLASRARAGVRVRLLLDGAPVGGVDGNARWCLAHLAAAGAEVYWLADGGEVGERYRSQHAKLAVIDDRTLLIGSENPGLGAAPSDDRADGMAGRRGVFVATDLPGAVAWARGLLRDDLDITRHVDLRPFQARDPRRGAPEPDFVPARGGGGAGYQPIASEPLLVGGPDGVPSGSTASPWPTGRGSSSGAIDDGLMATLLTAPENALDPTLGLLGLLARARPGDVVRVEQLDEPAWWGDGESEGDVAANPRVAAYLAAARRGASVRVLLDAFFDDPSRPVSNAATAAYLNAAAQAERLDLQARVGNPTGQGIHNKLVLVTVHDLGTPEYWSHIGSLNGTEAANKANREAVIQLRARAVHDYLAAVFDWDWAASGANAIWLPRVGG